MRKKKKEEKKRLGYRSVLSMREGDGNEGKAQREELPSTFPPLSLYNQECTHQRSLKRERVPIMWTPENQPTVQREWLSTLIKDGFQLSRNCVTFFLLKYPLNPATFYVARRAWPVNSYRPSCHFDTHQKKCKLITTKFQGLVCIISTEYLKRAERLSHFPWPYSSSVFLFFSGFVADKRKEKKYKSFQPYEQSWDSRS